MISSINDVLYNDSISSIEDGETVDLRVSAAGSIQKDGKPLDIDVVIPVEAIFHNKTLQKFKIGKAYDADTEKPYRLDTNDTNLIKKTLTNFKTKDLQEM